MDTLLMKYFNCQTTDAENQKIMSWLADDPDGSHKAQYQSARFIFEASVMQQTVSDKSFTADEKVLPLRNKSHRTWKSFVGACLEVAAVAVLAVGMFFFAKDSVYDSVSEKMLTAVVPEGQTFQLVLEDGTSMYMNSGTELQYPAVFAKDKRIVNLLHGEVLFEVARDEKRPFIVDNFASEIQVLGTRFNVEADPDRDFCSTALIRGSVRIDPKFEGESVLLAPNMMATIEHGNMTVTSLDNIEGQIDWTNGVINLQGMDFVSLMRLYEKTFGVKIVVETMNVPEISFTRGKIRVSDGIDHALSILQMASDFNYIRDFETNTIYIR